MVICGGSLAGSNGSGLPSGPFGGGGGAAPSASTKLRPNAMRAPSTVKKFGVTPATTTCSGLPSSPTRGPGNAAIPAIDSNAVARSRRSSQSPGMIGKSMTLRARMSDLTRARRFGLDVRKRPQQDGVHHAEDRGGCTGAQRDRDDGREGERRVLAERSDGKAEVFDEHRGGPVRGAGAACGDLGRVRGRSAVGGSNRTQSLRARSVPRRRRAKALRH